MSCKTEKTNYDIGGDFFIILDLLASVTQFKESNLYAIEVLCGVCLAHC